MGYGPKYLGRICPMAWQVALKGYYRVARRPSSKGKSLIHGLGNSQRRLIPLRPGTHALLVGGHQIRLDLPEAKA